MRVVYSSRYDIDLGAHVYPTRKYRLVREQLRRRQVVPPDAVVEPETVSWRDLALVHTDEYLNKVRHGQLSLTEVAQLEIPWSAGIADGFRLMTGGTLTAARQAAVGSPAFHIGGGFHHAFADHGEGFCLFNDVALAIRALQRDGTSRRAAIVDLDVHHGNGTAKIFETDAAVFTLSMHQQNNYPTEKPPSSLDIGLADGAGDVEYLDRLAAALPVVLTHEPDALFYLAGADPYERDQLGGLGLTKAGLRVRDRLVLESARDAGVSVVVVLAGGYAHDVNDTIDIHVATAEEAARVD